MKKVIKYFLCIVLLSIFMIGCSSENIESSSIISESVSMVVGSAYEWGNEYPYYNESVDFSDVSIPLISEKPSSSSDEKDLLDETSTNKSPSDKSSSKKTSSMVTTTSLKSSSKNTSTDKQSSKESSSSKKLSVGTSTSQGSIVTTINHKTVKAVWISYIDFADILTGKTEKQFRTNFENVCKNATDFGLNTLICQVRAFGDAIYPSEYFAWSQMAMGVGKNPGFDPLKIMIEISHKYNLSFHAWINPFRTFLNSQISSVPSNTIFKKWYNDSSKKGKYIVNYGNRWYYNPGEPDVRELILDGVKEIINNYSVDGIHFDDYFYPTIDSTFDSKTYKAYSKGKTLEVWRRENITKLVESVYDAVKDKSKNIVFGISPQANIENDMNEMYADVELWATKNGYVDYLCPQIYYSYKSETLNFTDTLKEWKNLVTASDVKLMVGLSPYRIGWYDKWACPVCSKNQSHNPDTQSCGKYGWITSDIANSNILERQYNDSMSVSKCKGVFLYSYEYIINTSIYSGTEYTSNAAEQAKIELKKLRAAMK